ncbi:MAG: GntR family transcriptional regulator [Sneathiella sp.]|nr:MAG: GntR family transcriptional regulator [Sneathiella sp.]
MIEERTLDFGPIQPKRIFEEICDRVRGQIANGKLCPGDKLPSERDLAEQFKVSRTAVREALRSLENSGLIQLRKGAKGGAFIIEGNQTLTRSLEDMISIGRITLADLTEARVLIQEVIVRLVCERATEEDFLALERDLDTVEQLTREGRLHEKVSYSINFYKVLAEITKNQVIIILIDSLTQILRRMIRLFELDVALDLVRTRRAFMRHLRAHDADSAIKEMTVHLNVLHDHLEQAQRKAMLRAAALPEMWGR